jgi:hypothetical protein
MASQVNSAKAITTNPPHRIKAWFEIAIFTTHLPAVFRSFSEFAFAPTCLPELADFSAILRQHSHHNQERGEIAIAKKKQINTQIPAARHEQIDNRILRISGI